MIPTYCAVWNWRNEKNKGGLGSIHIRIGLKNTYKYYLVPVPMRVRVDQWAGKPNAWVKNTHPFSFEINERIKEKLDVLDKLAKRHYTAKKSLNFPLIFRELGKDYNPNSLNKYFDQYIKSPREVLDD